MSRAVLRHGRQRGCPNACSHLSYRNILYVTPAKFKLMLVAAAVIALVQGLSAFTEDAVPYAAAFVKRAIAVRQ